MGLPGFEPGSVDSESTVLTNYTTGPWCIRVCISPLQRIKNLSPEGIHTAVLVSVG